MRKLFPSSKLLQDFFGGSNREVSNTVGSHRHAFFPLTLHNRYLNALFLFSELVQQRVIDILMLIYGCQMRFTPTLLSLDRP